MTCNRCAEADVRLEEAVLAAVLVERAACVEAARTSPTGRIAAAKIKARGGPK